MNADVIPPIQIVDADTHLVEPPDLWTARMPSRWGDVVPHVRWDEQHQEEAWFVGDQRLAPVAAAAQAGWSEYPPDHPRCWTDADPATWDPKLRLGRMDEYGIHAQVLYPNVALFSSAMLQEVDEPSVQLAMRAGLQRLPDRVRERRARPLPSDDLAALLGPRRDARRRCSAAPTPGTGASSSPRTRRRSACPDLTDRHWDPMWAAAQEMRLPVNFHIASGDSRCSTAPAIPTTVRTRNYASMGVSFFMGNARTIAS